MLKTKTNLTVGRGRLFFNPFQPGTTTPTVEYYIGNTPAFSVTRTVESVKRVRSVRGVKVSSDPIPVSESYSGSFTTDNINHENIANWFGSDAQDFYALNTEVFTSFTYQKGAAFNLADVIDLNAYSSDIEQVQASVSGESILVDRNFDLSDAKYGRIYVRPDATDVFDNTVVDLRIVTRVSKTSLINSEYRSVRGSLRFLSKNPVGSDFEYVYPLVELTPSGAIDLKSDDFQILTFNIDILKLNVNTPHQIIRVIDRLIGNENFLIGTGLSITEFLALEDLLDAVTNSRLPQSTKVRL